LSEFAALSLSQQAGCGQKQPFDEDSFPPEAENYLGFMEIYAEK